MRNLASYESKAKNHLFTKDDNYLSKIASEDLGVETVSAARTKIIKKIKSMLTEKARTHVRFDVQILPWAEKTPGGTAFSDRTPDFSGFISLSLPTVSKKKIVVIPIVVRDFELSPIDSFEFAGRKFVFSRRSMYALGEAFEEIIKNPYILDGEDAFEGLAEPASDITDHNPLRRVLMIRNTSAGGANLSMPEALERTATEHLDKFLDKTASVDCFEDMAGYLTAAAKMTADNITKREFEKIASDIEDIGLEVIRNTEVFNTLKKMPFKKIGKIKAKTLEIVSVDRHSRNIKIKEAAKFDKVQTLAGPVPFWNDKFDVVANQKPILIDSAETLIVDEDGEIKMIRSNSGETREYLAIDSKPAFTIKTKSLKTIVEETDPRSPHKQYLMILGNKVVAPVSLRVGYLDLDAHIYSPAVPSEKISDKAVGDFSFVEKKFISLSSERRRNNRFAGEERDNSTAFVLDDTYGKDMTFFNFDESRDYLENLFDSQDDFEYTKANIRGLSLSHVSVINPDVQMMEISGWITTPVKSLTDVIFAPGITDDPIDKVASGISLTITKPVPDQDSFKVLISEGLKKKKFGPFSQADTIATLKTIGVAESEISGMIGFLNAGERTITRDIDNVDMSLIDGTKTQQTEKNLIQKFKESSFGRPQATNMLKEVVSEQLADLIASGDMQNVGRGLQAMEIFASDAAALSETFEKLAIEHQSRDFQKLAKLCVATNRVDQLVAQSFGHDTHFFLKEASEDLREIKPLIEKAAGMISELSEDQQIGKRYISDNVVTQTIATLDRLHAYSNMI